MFIELPNSIKEEEILKYARIENGTLHFWNLWKFQEIMSVLRKEMSSNRCIYCGCDLKNYTTMDHLYPVTYGGINITDNLGLACKTCNSNKASLTRTEFEEMLLNKKFEKELKKNVNLVNQLYLKEVGFRLPKSWYEEIELSSIKTTKREELINTYKYFKILKKYKKYKKLPYPIIVDKNSVVIDEYTTYCFAKQNDINFCYIVKLENVELHF